MKQSRRIKPLTLVLILFAGIIAWSGASYLSNRSAEIDAIRIRYAEMHRALVARDEAAALKLIVPAARGKPETRVLGLDFVVQPLNDSSSISVHGNEASITPRRLFHYYVLPGGNSVEMLKVDGEWYFTGGVSVD